MTCWLAGSSTEPAEMPGAELDVSGFGDGRGRAKGHGFGDKEGALK